MRVCKALKSLYTGDICTGFSAWSVLELTGTDTLDICHQWTIKPTWTNLTIDPQCLRLNIVLFDGVLGRKFRGLIFVHTALVVCRGKTELVDHSNLNYRWIHLVSSVGRGQILWYVWAYMVSGFYRKKMSHSAKKPKKIYFGGLVLQHQHLYIPAQSVQFSNTLCCSPASASACKLLLARDEAGSARDVSCVQTGHVDLCDWHLRTDPHTHTHTHTHTHARTVNQTGYERFVMSSTWSTWVHSGFFLIYSLSSGCQPITASGQEELRDEAPTLPRSVHLCLPPVLLSLHLSLVFALQSVYVCLSRSFFGHLYSLSIYIYVCVCVVCVREREWVCLYVCVLFPSGLSVIRWPWPSPELLHKYLLSRWQAHTHTHTHRHTHKP